MPTAGVQNVKALYLFFGCAITQKPGKGYDVTFSNSIFGTSECHTTKHMTFFWNSDKKTGKWVCFLNKVWIFMLSFTLTLPDLCSNVKMSVTIEYYVPNNPKRLKSMYHTNLVLYFHTVTSFDLTLALTCT